MKIYISGQISGVDYDLAFSKFEKAENKVISELLEIEKVINPMKLHPRLPERKWEYYMSVDLAELMICDAIYMLNCWGQSKGGRVEYAVAKELGLKIFFED